MPAAKRGRSKTSQSSSQTRNTRSSAEDIATPGEKDIGAASTTTEYQENLIDWDDDVIESGTQDATVGVELEEDTIDPDCKVVEAAEKPVSTPAATTSSVNADATFDANDADASLEYTEEQVQQAKGAVVWSVDTLIGNAPYLTSALLLNSVGDRVTVKVPLNGLNIEVSWKVVGTYDIEVQPLDTEQLAALPTDPQLDGKVSTETASAHNVIESIE